MNRKFISNSNLVLRKILNSNDNIDILKDFIESFLKVKIQKIKINYYLKNQERYLPSEERFGISDVRVLLDNGEERNIGIQFIDGYYIKTKMLLYYYQINSNQNLYSDNRKKAKTITLNFLDFPYMKENTYHKKIHLKPINEKKELEDDIEVHLIELPKFKIEDTSNLSKEEMWMMYLIGDIEIKNKKGASKIKKLDNLLEEYWKSEKME